MVIGDPVLALGLMSGTSCDGIDAALLTTDGRSKVAFGPVLTDPYPDDFRRRLRGVLGGRGPVDDVGAKLPRRHAEGVARLLRSAGIDPSAVSVLGFHGQTILHEPENRRTW